MPKPGGVSAKPLSGVIIVLVALVVVLTQRSGTSPHAANNATPDTAHSQAAKASETRSPAPAASAPAAVAPGAGAGAVSTLRIASWNIEWLGKPEDRSGLAKNVAQSAEDLADYIRSSNAAIVAVQEIVSRERGLPIRSPELEGALANLRQTSKQNWDYVLFPGRADGDQLTGVLWNRDVVTAINQDGKPWDQARDRPWALPIPKGRSGQGSSLWNRPPHAMKFSAGPGRTDVVLIVLHMKADYNGDFAAHRREEAAVLVRSLPQVRAEFKDEDLVLIGDTNCPRGPEAATRDIEAAGFADLNAFALATHWQGGTMDRAFVPLAQPEFNRRGFEVLSDLYLKKRGLTPRDFKRRYSDHYLIVTAVDIGPDDD